MTDHVPRDLGPFAIDPELAAVLAQLRARGGALGAGEVDADRVRAVEIGVVFRFPDDVLAVFAADVPSLRDDWGFDLDRVVAHTGELRDRGARGDLIGLARREGVFACVAKSQESLPGTPASATELTLWSPDETPHKVPLRAWLAARLEELPAAGGGEQPFSPTLSRVRPGSTSGRRVRHKKFGDGNVLVETGTGPTRKVKVDFPRVGMKLLQARFLEFLDDGEAGGSGAD